MIHFLLRALVAALGLWLADYLLSGISVDGVVILLVAAVLLGIVNAVIRPILMVLSFPFILLTLGLFMFVVNAAMLGLVGWLLPGFNVDGFGSALIGSIIVSLTSWVGSAFIGPKESRRAR